MLQKNVSNILIICSYLKQINQFVSYELLFYLYYLFLSSSLDLNTYLQCVDTPGPTFTTTHKLRHVQFTLYKILIILYVSRRNTFAKFSFIFVCKSMLQIFILFFNTFFLVCLFYSLYLLAFLLILLKNFVVHSLKLFQDINPLSSSTISFK